MHSFFGTSKGSFFAETIHRRPLSESLVLASFYVALVFLVFVYIVWESFMSASLSGRCLSCCCISSGCLVSVSCVRVSCWCLMACVFLWRVFFLFARFLINRRFGKVFTIKIYFFLVFSSGFLPVFENRIFLDQRLFTVKTIVFTMSKTC